MGGPDNSSAIAASPFYVSLPAGGKSSSPALVPATPCASMLSNGSCYYLPAPCSSFTRFLPNGTHVSSHFALEEVFFSFLCSEMPSLSCQFQMLIVIQIGKPPLLR